MHLFYKNYNYFPKIFQHIGFKYTNYLEINKEDVAK